MTAEKYRNEKKEFFDKFEIDKTFLNLNKYDNYKVYGLKEDEILKKFETQGK